MTRLGLDCSDVSFGGFRIGLFFLLTVVRVGSSPAPDEEEEGSASVYKALYKADLDESTSDTDCTGHFGGRPRRAREPRAATGTRFNGIIMLTNPGAQVLKGSTYVPIFTISALKEIIIIKLTFGVHGSISNHGHFLHVGAVKL